MTERKKITTPADDPAESSAGLSEDTFDLLDWIQSGTVARRQVTIHNDPALVTEYEQLQARLDELGYNEDDDDRRDSDASLGEGHGAQIEQTLDQMEDLYARWQESRSVWTVRAVSQDEVTAAYKKVPDPKMPVPPGDNAPRRIRDEFGDQVRTYSQEKAEADEERKLVLLATAVVEIATPRGTADHATVEQLKVLRSRPHGQQWITLLHEAMEAATENDVEIPRPTSSGRSATSQE